MRACERPLNLLHFLRRDVVSVFFKIENNGA